MEDSYLEKNRIDLTREDSSNPNEEVDEISDKEPLDLSKSLETSNESGASMNLHNMLFHVSAGSPADEAVNYIIVGNNEVKCAVPGCKSVYQIKKSLHKHTSNHIRDKHSDIIIPPTGMIFRCHCEMILSLGQLAVHRASHLEEENRQNYNVGKLSEVAVTGKDSNTEAPL